MTSGPAQTLVESWDGSTWSVASSPDPLYGTNNLNAVSCPPGAPCVAVGQWTGPGGVSSTLVEAASATPWAIMPSPNKGAVTNGLNGVACPAVDSCVAVGFYDAKPGVPHTLVESWSGGAWSIVPSPNYGTGKAVLNGVSCLTPATCVAVGYYLDVAGTEHSLVERWSGSAWTAMSPQSPGAGDNVLTGVSCATSGVSTLCAAVGHYFTSTGIELPLAETSTGGKWTTSSVPNPGASVNDLAGVSCPATNFCAAAGSYLTAGLLRQTLVEAWNGTEWSVQPSPDQDSSANALFAISCTSSAACMAVGTATTAARDEATLAAALTGTAWAITPTRNGRYKENLLSGVACAGPVTCVAVGHSFTLGITADVTLGEQYQ